MQNNFCKNRFEVTLSRWPRLTFVNAKRLDLTHPDAGPINKVITNIGMLYANDFKETVTAPTAIVTHHGAPVAPITVQLLGGPLTEDPCVRVSDVVAIAIVVTMPSLIALVVAIRGH